MKKLCKRYRELYETKEWAKQLSDQSVHIVVGMAATDMLASAFKNVWIGAGLVVIAWAVREYKQWPSVRKWDPYVDWFFEAVGVGLGLGVAWYL